MRNIVAESDEQTFVLARKWRARGLEKAFRARVTQIERGLRVNFSLLPGSRHRSIFRTKDDVTLNRAIFLQDKFPRRNVPNQR